MINRLSHSLRALQIAPNARAAERDEMVRRLPPGLVVELASWDGALADAIVDRVVCVERDPRYAAELRKRHRRVICAPTSAVPIKDNFADVVAILVGLHHRSDRAAIFTEARRILKPGGRIVVAEVQAGSTTAAYLDSVPMHRGLYPVSLAAEMAAAGFVDCVEDVVDCPWVFDSEEQARAYVEALFAAPVEPLPGLVWSWPLLFAEGTAP